MARDNTNPQTTNNNVFDLIHPRIVAYWRKKYGAYLKAYSSTDCIVFVENGTLDSFHPSGDRLAVHHKYTCETRFIWNNKVKEPLTEVAYLLKIDELENS